MHEQGIHPSMNTPSRAPTSRGPTHPPWRVLADDGPELDRVAAPVARSVALPIPVTELTELLAGDDTLCVRPRPPLRLPAAAVDATVAGPVLDRRDARCGRDEPREDPCETNRDLTRVIDAWPGLSEDTQSAILALIESPYQGA